VSIPLRIRRIRLLIEASSRVWTDEGPGSFAAKTARRMARSLLAGEPLARPPELVVAASEYRNWLETAVRARNSRQAGNPPQQPAYQPLVSVLTPVYDVDEAWLRRAIESVIMQSYPNWELCLVDDASRKPHVRRVLSEYAAANERIKVRFLRSNSGISEASNRALELAEGEFVALLDHDDELTPDALLEVTRRLERDPSLDLVYTDEDKYARGGALPVEPFFKPDWSPDLLRSMNYITHLSVFRRSLVEDMGGFRAGLEGSQDYDLLLRFTERTNRIAHVPKVCYHWRKIAGSAAVSSDSKPYAYRAAERALSDALRRQGREGKTRMIAPGRYRVQYAIAGTPPVSFVVAARGGNRAMAKSLAAMASKTAYRNIELIVVGAPDWQEIARRLPESGLAIRHAPGRPGAGWATTCNLAASSARGQYLLFLDGLTRPLNPQWLEALLEHAQREEVGAVGSTLVRRNGYISQAGVVLCAGGAARYAYRDLDAGSPGYVGLAHAVRDCSAVTGASMMIRADLFLDVGGFDEHLVPPWAEVDLCLRLRHHGYQVVCTPFSRLLQHRGATRRALPSNRSAALVVKRWGEVIADGDPYFSPNLVPEFDIVRLRVPSSDMAGRKGSDFA